MTSPEPDDLTGEFYQTFKDLLRVLLKWFCSGLQNKGAIPGFLWKSLTGVFSSWIAKCDMKFGGIWPEQGKSELPEAFAYNLETELPPLHSGKNQVLGGLNSLEVSPNSEFFNKFSW